MRYQHSGDPRVSKLHDALHERVERHADRHGRSRGFERGRSRGFGGHDSRRGHRAGRGDVRAAVLALLGEAPMHGYQIIQELAERSGGAWTPSPGSIYPALQLLQDEGLVSATETDGKRVFSLTDAGREEAAKRGDGPPPWEVAASGEGTGFGQLRSGFMQLGAAVHQIGSAGSEPQIAKAVGILATTRRELYRILAEDEPSEDQTT